MNRITHTSERITEEHGGRRYPVKLRTPEETARLYRLMTSLERRRVFQYKIGDKSYNVQAISSVEAAGIGRQILDLGRDIEGER